MSATGNATEATATAARGVAGSIWKIASDGVTGWKNTIVNTAQGSNALGSVARFGVNVALLPVKLVTSAGTGIAKFTGRNSLKFGENHSQLIVGAIAAAAAVVGYKAVKSHRDTKRAEGNLAALAAQPDLSGHARVSDSQLADPAFAELAARQESGRREAVGQHTAAHLGQKGAAAQPAGRTTA